MIRLLKDFGSVQMYQIKLGLKQNIDVSIYAKSKINSGKMARIRHFNSFKKCRRMQKNVETDT